MSNDNRSGLTLRLTLQSTIVADGVYPLDPIDTASLSGIGFFLVSYHLEDGSYSLAFDESDNGVDWIEVPVESVIGGVTVTADPEFGGIIEVVGLFSVKRYVRPKIVATDVTIGVEAITVGIYKRPSVLPGAQV